jgi:DNA repair exonuclease SbcCD ATPase subunit
MEHYEELEAYFAANSDPTDLLADKQVSVQDLNSEIEALQVEAGNLGEAFQNYTDLETIIVGRKGTEKTLEKNLAMLGERTAQIEKKMREIDKSEAEITSVSEAIAGGQRIISAYILLKEQVFHAKGVPQYAINKWAGPLGIQAGEYLDALTGGRYSKVELEAFTKGRSYGYKISVFDTDRGFRPVDSFSGGEQTQINAALRFAVTKLLLKLSFSAPRFLFIDEGDLGSLDADDARRDFINVLLDMGKEYRQLVLITHFPEVAEPFEAQYSISIVDGTSRITRNA